MATALLRLAALTGVVALLLPGTAEARVLLSLDDFCAVGDGIADDTHVRLREHHRAGVPGGSGPSGGKWLQFFQVEDLMVSGGDVIDGRVQEWWAQACKGKKHLNDKYELDGVHDATPRCFYGRSPNIILTVTGKPVAATHRCCNHILLQAMAVCHLVLVLMALS
ncbi:hypothetical protein ZWY2020_032835 [Hordeum vulgare]|nr:hypothetical protein ZWY2020_032835 [Hordeum vulgare]